MPIADRLPTLDDASLANLRSNAERLQSGDGARQQQAAQLLPLIDAELAEREARKPPKPVRATRRKTPVAKPAADADAPAA